MVEKLLFYLRHSINDLRVNLRRTVFALLCITAGVSAIVSLQTLAVMIQDTLTGSLQITNKGDLRVFVGAGGETSVTFGDNGRDEARARLIEQGEAEGVVRTNRQSFFGQTFTDNEFSPEAIQIIRDWFDTELPGALGDITGRSPGANQFTSGISIPARGTQATFVSTYLVDASKYPLYGEVRSLAGQPLREVVSGPMDIAINEGLATKLDAQIGDEVRVNGSTATYTLRAIVPDSAEAGFQGIFSALFGYAYLDISTLEYFTAASPGPNNIYIRLNDVADDEERLLAINRAFLERFPYLSTVTTAELRVQNAQISDTLNQLVTIMGLISLLIGGIGIVNTMQVIVRRRTVEVAVLKTLGLQANQVTVLFLVEAFILGIIGSLAGIVLGWVMTFVIRGGAEVFLGQSLTFRITPGPALNGLLVGTLVTTIFGFLPTLSAGQVRPAVVLRPNDAVVPRAGLGRSFLALLVVILALSVVAQGVLGSFQTALLVIVGTFIAAGWLYFLLWVLIYLIGRFFPTFRLVDLKVALRSMFAMRRRGASTLLALAVGVFSLSLITLLATTIGNLFTTLLVNQSGGNLIVYTGGVGALARTEETLRDFPGVNSYAITGTYTVIPVEVLKADGTRIAYDDLVAEARQRPEVEGLQVIDSLDAITARDVASNLPAANLVAGRNLEPSDAGQPVMVIQDETLLAIRRGGPPIPIRIGLEVGDSITFELTGQAGQRVTFTIVGLVSSAQIGGLDSTSYNYVPRDAFPAGTLPNQIAAVVDVDEEQIGALQRAFSAIPGTFALETRFLNDVLNTLLGQFTAFPVLVAALGLFVGGVVIANSVALTTMERRREIAIMKAVGLQRERVLGMLLLENAVMGLIGGLIGVGIGLIGVIISQVSLQALAPGVDLSGVVPYGTALLLMGLCIVVALVAAMVTAWGASGEKPLIVLRAE